MNHEPFMERCNMLGDNLTDAWDIKGINHRAQAKVIMRTVYGSSKTCIDMWKEDNIPYVLDDVIAYNNALDHGEIALGDRFSKFIINNCNLQELNYFHVRDEKFEVECNRFRNVGEKLTVFDLYDTNSRSIKRIHHTETKRVADLKQFRRFPVTGLIHNLDSQVEDVTVEAVYDEFKWCEDLHDAVILCCEAADLARETYARELEDIHMNRQSILSNYFKSIGIPSSALEEWKKVKEVVVPFEGEFKCNPMVLK